MTQEIMEKLAGIRAEAEALAKEYNAAVDYDPAEAGEGAPAPRSLFAIETEMREKIAEYTNTARRSVYDECLAAENPMLEAVTRLEFGTIAMKDEKVEDSDLTARRIVDKVRPIDLLDFNKAAPDGVGADKNWAHIAQKINFLLTADKCRGLGINPKTISDCYTMTEIAREINLGKTPTSNTNMLKTLQMVITAMLGDGYKPTSHDVVYLKSIYSRKGKKALSLQCADHKRFVSYIAEVCNHIVTGNPYGVESKEIKSK